MNQFYVCGAVVLVGALGLAGCGDRPDPKAPVAVSSAVLPEVAAPVNAMGPRYDATLAEGIDFRKPGYPNFLSKVSGMSGPEPWGRWTDGSIATLKFNEMLPKKFTLKLHAGAWGENVNKAIKFRIGSVEKDFVFKGDPFSGPSTVALDFTLSEPADALQITVPFPVADNTNPRRIGLGLITLKIESNSN